MARASPLPVEQRPGRPGPGSDECGRSGVPELAAECGLTVRALRHFEQKGLLAPVQRTAGGRRCYDRDDVEQVYRVVALRSLGLPLDQIGAALRTGPTLRRALVDHLALVEQQLAGLTQLRSRLQRLLASEPSHPVSIEELTDVIRRTMTPRAVPQDVLDDYLSPAQQAQLAERSEILGDDATRHLATDYPRLYAAAQRQLDAGAPYDAPAVQAVAAELEGLSRRWSTGETETSDAVQRMWADRSVDIAGQDYGDLAAYVAAARSHYRAARPFTE